MMTELLSESFTGSEASPGRPHQMRHLLEERHSAGLIQRALVSVPYPELARFSFAAQYLPAADLSGDLYGVVLLDDQTVALYVADISGHGIGPALIAAYLIRALDDLLAHGDRATLLSPGRVLELVRERFTARDFGDHYLTMVYAVLHTARHRLVYASAGHWPPLLAQGGGIVETEAANGPILSPHVEGGLRWPERALAFPPGSRVIFYTDGLIEARDRAGVPYGLPALRRLLLEGRHLGGEDWARRVVDAVRRHGGGELEDDLTLLTISAEG